jgi:hypothetical protein
MYGSGIDTSKYNRLMFENIAFYSLLQVSRIELTIHLVYDHTVGAVARAFSEGLGRTLAIRDLDGVNIVNK